MSAPQLPDMPWSFVWDDAVAARARRRLTRPLLRLVWASMQAILAFEAIRGIAQHPADANWFTNHSVFGALATFLFAAGFGSMLTQWESDHRRAKLCARPFEVVSVVLDATGLDWSTPTVRFVLDWRSIHEARAYTDGLVLDAGAVSLWLDASAMDDATYQALRERFVARFPRTRWLWP